jgi:hypothetical protein
MEKALYHTRRGIEAYRAADRDILDVVNTTDNFSPLDHRHRSIICLPNDGESSSLAQ